MSTSKSTPRGTIRRDSMSLISPCSPSSILILPPELILEILEIATHANDPFALALVCKAISQFIDHILYRTVVLNSPKSIALFFRTTTTKPASFLPGLVTKISVTITELPSLAKAQLVAIVKACTGSPIIDSTQSRQSNTVRFELHLKSYIDFSEESISTSSIFDDRPNPLSLVTHLRICEPGYVWQAPSSLLPPYTSNLTHLHICRRAFANEDNDAEFLEDVKYFLKFPEMKMLVVGIFPSFVTNDSEALDKSAIWQALQEMQAGEGRLFIIEGRYGSWASERGVSTVSGPPDFWRDVRKGAKGVQGNTS